MLFTVFATNGDGDKMSLFTGHTSLRALTLNTISRGEAISRGLIVDAG
jgi:hypothetical protein